MPLFFSIDDPTPYMQLIGYWRWVDIMLSKKTHLGVLYRSLTLNFFTGRLVYMLGPSGGQKMHKIPMHLG